MPATLVPGTVLDARGRPITSFGTLYRRSRDDDQKRPAPPNHYGDFSALLSAHTYRQLTSESRAAASRGFVNALIESKTGYVSASDYAPRFTGTDTRWGELATAWLREATAIGNIRGSRFDWKSSWRPAVRNFADAGAFFVLLTAWPDTQQPALQFIEAHRVGCRDLDVGLVGENDAYTDTVAADGTTRRIRGAYRGLPINNGIITNRAGTEVAVRILGATKDDDQDISLRDLIFVGAPKAYSESRPWPDLAPGLLDFLALDLAQTSALDQQIADARRDLIEETPTGLPPTGPVVTGVASETSAQGTPTSVVERGQYRFIKTGNKITALDTSRPSDQWMNFDMRVAKRTARTVRWAAEMLDPEALKGGATRAFQDQINTLIKDDFTCIATAATRCVRYFIAKAVQSGALPASDQWRSWTIATPPWFQVDRQSARIDLEELDAGRTSMSHLVAQDGHTLADIMRQRAADYKTAEQIATDTGVPLQIVLGTLGAQKPAQPAAPGSSTRDNPQLNPA